MAKQQVYDASAIQALKGLEPVRRMPGMYTHTVHPLHIVQEAIDNAVDEALAGFGKSITVSVFKDGSVEVEDEGRGIPVDMHTEEKKPAVEVAFTMLHAGGKFSRSGDGVYHISGGLHGVGVAVSNALSKRCEVTVYRDGREAHHRVRGRRAQEQAEERKDQGQAYRHRSRLWPDPKYFDSPNIPMNELEHLVRSKAYLLPGLTMVLEVEGKQTKLWKYERGMAQYFEMMLDGRELVAPLFTGERYFDEKSLAGHHRHRAGRGRVVGDRLGGRRRHLRRQPRQPDPDALGRHARGRLPLRHLRGARRVHGGARASRPRA